MQGQSSLGRAHDCSVNLCYIRLKLKAAARDLKAGVEN
jgi:hypothetical protein